MSVRATTWVWDHSRAEGNDRLVALAIADQASIHNDDTVHTCWPSVTTLAEMCLLSKRTVQRSIRTLEGLGEITVAPHEAWTGRKDRRPNVYTMPLERHDNVTPREHERGDKPGMNGVTNGVDSTGDTLSVEPKEEPKGTTGANAPSADWETTLPPVVAKIVGTTFPDPFEKTWALYPKERRKEKRGTYKAWRATVVRMVDGEGFTPKAAMLVLYRATETYGKAMTARVESGQSAWEYVKLATTFYGPSEPWRDWWGVHLGTTPIERAEWQA